jgi:hypothetical protein
VIEVQRSNLKEQQGSEFKQDSDKDTDEYKLFMQDYATNPAIEYSTSDLETAGGDTQSGKLCSLHN